MDNDNTKTMSKTKINFKEFLPDIKGETKMIQPEIDIKTYHGLKKCLAMTGLTMNATVDSVLRAYIEWELNNGRKKQS